MRLLRGDMAQATVYGKDPATIARRFEHEGAELIHIVDLDGAIAGEPRNLDAVRAIRDAVGCKLDVSGGLRSMASVRQTFACGANYVSLGSVAFLDPALLNEACREFRGCIFGSLDLRNGRLAIRGWVETSKLTVAEAVLRFRDAGVAALIVTDTARDGTETGANITLFSEVARVAKLPVIASGGLATLDDLKALSTLFSHGIVGAITGRAIYEGRFTLSEAHSFLNKLMEK